MLFLRGYPCPIGKVFRFAVISESRYWSSTSSRLDTVIGEDVELKEGTTVALDDDDFIAPLEFFKCL